MPKHTQCKMENDDGRLTVSWIPEKYASLGKYVKLEEDNGWRVIGVWDSADSEEVLKRQSENRRGFGSVVK